MSISRVKGLKVAQKKFFIEINVMLGQMSVSVGSACLVEKG